MNTMPDPLTQYYRVVLRHPATPPVRTSWVPRPLAVELAEKYKTLWCGEIWIESDNTNNSGVNPWECVK